MSLERRLQHASRELRAVDVAVPPLGRAPSIRRGGSGRRLGLQMVAVPLLFVVGGLVVMGVLGERRPTGSTFDDTPGAIVAVADPASTSEPLDVVVTPTDWPTADSPTADSPTVAAASIAAPSAADERVVIDRIMSATERSAPGRVAGAQFRPLGFTGPL